MNFFDLNEWSKVYRMPHIEMVETKWLIIVIVNIYWGNTVCISLHACPPIKTVNSRIISTLLYNIIVTAQNGFLYKEIYNKDFKVMAPLLTFTQRDFLSSSQKPVIVLFFSYCVF